MAGIQVGCPREQQSVVIHSKSAVAIPLGKRPATRMSVKEFTQWVMRMDGNDDGVISFPELENSLKELGLWFTNWKAKQAIGIADINNNGIIDTDLELKELIEFAQKQWGLEIYED